MPVRGRVPALITRRPRSLRLLLSPPHTGGDMSWLRGTLAVLVVVLLPSAVAAQATSSSIAGVVKDATGAVLPGVTVEAASPALIEKTRSVITDAEGNYKIVDLRPGTYSVTFTLAGFSTVKREGIELTS